MKLENLIDIIQESEPPGWSAQVKMASPFRRNYTYEEVGAKARRAAVLLLLYEREGRVVFPLNKRHEYPGVHSGQIGLPGGSLDGSETNEQAALRETEEELSIPRSKIEIIKPLSQIYVPPSKFLVSPFTGFLQEAPEIVKDETEVKEVIEVGIDELWDKRNLKKTSVKVYGLPLRVPAFVIRDEVIWGATAMILSEFVALTKKE